MFILLEEVVGDIVGGSGKISYTPAHSRKKKLLISLTAHGTWFA
jgi:hypothetical protein